MMVNILTGVARPNYFRFPAHACIWAARNNAQSRTLHLSAPPWRGDTSFVSFAHSACENARIGVSARLLSAKRASCVASKTRDAIIDRKGGARARVRRRVTTRPFNLDPLREFSARSDGQTSDTPTHRIQNFKTHEPKTPWTWLLICDIDCKKVLRYILFN